MATPFFVEWKIYKKPKTSCLYIIYCHLQGDSIRPIFHLIDSPVRNILNAFSFTIFQLIVFFGLKRELASA